MSSALLVAALSVACGSGNETTGPSPLPAPNSTIVYTALGASDVLGIGGSVACAPWDDCAGGRGYVQVAGRELRSRGFTVNVHPLGVPGAVLSRRILVLGQRYRSDLLTNIMEQEVPFILPTTTLVTIFAGGNDVNALTSAIGGGAAGADRNGFINSQIAAFGQDFAALIAAIRQRVPSARIVVLNLPNQGGMPYLTNAARDHRLAAQMLSVGFTRDVLNPLVASDITVIDLMCDARAYQVSTYSADGFHPSDTGYAWLAAEVVSAATTAYRRPSTSCAQMSIVQ